MIIDGVELRPQEASGCNPRTRTLERCGHAMRLLNLDIQCLSLSVSGSILNGQGISSVLFGRNFHTAIVRRPNRVVLRLKLHDLSVGHAITELQCLPAVDHPCAGVKALDGQFFPPKLIDGLAVRVELLLRPFFGSTALDL